MLVKFTIHTYASTSRTAVCECTTKEQIECRIAFYMSDTTGNTKNVVHSLYVPPNPTTEQLLRSIDDADQFAQWYPIKVFDPKLVERSTHVHQSTPTGRISSSNPEIQSVPGTPTAKLEMAMARGLLDRCFLVDLPKD